MQSCLCQRPLWREENEHLAVVVHEDASAAIHDKKNDVTWRMGPVALQEEGPIDVGHVWLRAERSVCEQFAGRFRGRMEASACSFTLLGREGQPLGDFRCVFSLDGPWFECRIVAIDEGLPNLIFPTPIESESLVLPQGIGRWIRKPLSARHFWVFPSHLNMRWFGGLRGDHGWLAIVDEGYQDAGVLAAALTATTGWLKSMGRWQGKRTVRFHFVRGNYVALAKAFRQYAREKGLFRSLEEKAQATPALQNMIGGRSVSLWMCRTHHPENNEDRLLPVVAGQAKPSLQVNFTYQEAEKMFAQIRDAGMGRGLGVLLGWLPGGYDESHPDVWPPEPALGTTDEFKALLAKYDSLVVGIHDNYQDIYRRSPSWPHGVVRTVSGDPMPGGFWAGGQAYILNSRDSVAYLHRNWEHLQTLCPRAVYCDTITAVQFYESYEPGNTQTRSEDEAYKIELMRFYKENGIVLGSECGADFGVPYTDFLLVNQERVPGETVPLWPLVFHDAAIGYITSDATITPPAQLKRQWLEQMLWGCVDRWYFDSQTTWERSLPAFAESFMVSRWNQRIAMSEMVSHRFLADDVEETVFANGLTLRVNLSMEPKQIEGSCIPPLGYIIGE